MKCAIGQTKIIVLHDAGALNARKKVTNMNFKCQLKQYTAALILAVLSHTASAQSTAYPSSVVVNPDTVTLTQGTTGAVTPDLRTNDAIDGQAYPTGRYWPNTTVVCEALPTGFVYNSSTGQIEVNDANLPAGEYTFPYKLCIRPQAAATITLTKISAGGIGTFNFSGDNGIGAETITTTAKDTAVTGTTHTLTTSGSITTVKETIPSGWKLSAAQCTGTGTGGSASYDLNTGTITLDAAATAYGSNITCAFTNKLIPNEPILTVNQPTCAAPTGAISITNYNAAYTYSVSPSAGVTINGASISAPAGTYTVTATDAQGESVSSQSVTLNATSNCTTRLTITKTTTGGIGSFNFSGNNGFSAETISTTTAGTGVNGVTHTLTNSGVVTTVTEVASSGWKLTAAQCTGMGAGGNASVNLSNGSISLDSAATAFGSNIACAFTNHLLPSAPILTVTQPTCAAPTGVITITNYNAAHTYSVSPSAGVTINGASISAPAGTYTVTATDAQGESVSSQSVTVNAWPGGCTIAGTIFTDVTDNNIADGTPYNFGRFFVVLYNADTNIVVATRTTFTGTFSFNNVTIPGVNYKVQISSFNNSLVGSIVRNPVSPGGGYLYGEKLPSSPVNDLVIDGRTETIFAPTSNVIGVDFSFRQSQS